MVDAQEYINQKYLTKEERKEVKALDLRNKGLEGELDLSDFINLRELNCGNNRLISLNLTNCQNLTSILCRKNQLTQLILPKSSNNLQKLFCWNNFLTDLDFSVLDGKKLIALSLSNNNFSVKDLSCFADLTKLKELYIGTVVPEYFQKGIYNRWTGSLESLKNLTQLEALRIDNTDINEGVEYLPNSMKEIFYSSEIRVESKIKEITWHLDLFTSGKQGKWEELGFTMEEIKQWMGLGLTVDDYFLADYLKNEKKLDPLDGVESKLKELRKEYSNLTWKDIHPDFTSELKRKWEELGFTHDQTKEWVNRGFTYQECKEWLDIGMKPTDVEYCTWLQDIEGLNPQNVLKYNSKEKLWKNYLKHFQNNKLDLRVIEQIKDFDHKNLTSEQEPLVKQLILNEKLRERYKRYGLCKECQQPNTGKRLSDTSSSLWCQWCNSQHFRQEFKNWTSGNPDIDQFIQQYQLKATTHREILEWIPYERLIGVEYLAEGGFGKVYKAERIDGYILNWSIKEKKWKRSKINPNGMVILKTLNDSQDITADFLQEIINHKLFHSNDFIINCRGISQDPKTKNYIMVMDYVQGGNLKKYLQNNYDKLEFKDKLSQLCSIAEGINSIHQQGLMHRDFHSGNILSGKDYKTYSTKCWITDLGLCRPTNETDKGKVFGVLPYVAPEVLLEKPYTQASDIYSFGMIMYEVLTGLPPYIIYDKKEKCYKELPHDLNLTLKICEGLRPQFNIKIPQLLEGLIERCWDADPLKRPTSEELTKFLVSWNLEINENKDSEFTKQVQNVEKYNKSLPDSIKSPNYEKNFGAIYTSRIVNTGVITKLLQNPLSSYSATNFGYSDELELDINNIDFDELEIRERKAEIIQEENVFEIEIPPKGSSNW